MAWVLTKQLIAFRDQMNATFPNRDKASDGTIGNTAHQDQTSGHNPDDTAGSKPEWDGDPDALAEVRAIDIDADTGNPSVTMEDIVQHLLRLARAGNLWFIRYIIYNRRIWSASNDWAQQAYTGSNPHDKHMHMSGAYNQDSDNYSAANYHLEDLVAFIENQADFTAALAAALIDPTVERRIGQGVFKYDPGWRNPEDHSEGVWPAISDATYPPGGNGSVGLGTAISSLLGRQQDQTVSLTAAIAAAPATDITLLAAAILAGLPPVVLTQAEVEEALRNVLRTGTDE